MLALPVVLEVLVALQHREEAEIHRSHVERAHLRRGSQRGGEPLLKRHAVAAAGRDIYHSISGLLDARKELHEDLGIRCRPAVLGVARMQVEDGGAGLGRADRLARYLVRGERQIRAHGRGMDRPSDGAGDDDFPGTGHGFLLGALFLVSQRAIWREEPAAVNGRACSAREGARRYPLAWMKSRTLG